MKDLGGKIDQYILEKQIEDSYNDEHFLGGMFPKSPQQRLSHTKDLLASKTAVLDHVASGNADAAVDALQDMQTGTARQLVSGMIPVRVHGKTIMVNEQMMMRNPNMSAAYNRVAAHTADGAVPPVDEVSGFSEREQSLESLRTDDKNLDKLIREVPHLLANRHHLLALTVDIRLNNLRAVIPREHTSHLSYLNSALVRPVVAYMNSHSTHIPVTSAVTLELVGFLHLAHD